MAGINGSEGTSIPQVRVVLLRAMVCRLEHNPEEARALEAQAATLPGYSPDRFVAYLIATLKRLPGADAGDQVQEVAELVANHVPDCSPHGKLLFWLGVGECFVWNGMPEMGLMYTTYVQDTISQLAPEEAPRYEDLRAASVSLARIAWRAINASLS